MYGDWVEFQWRLAYAPIVLTSSKENLAGFIVSHFSCVRTLCSRIKLFFSFSKMLSSFHFSDAR